MEVTRLRPFTYTCEDAVRNYYGPLRTKLILFALLLLFGIIVSGGLAKSNDPIGWSGLGFFVGFVFLIGRGHAYNISQLKSPANSVFFEERSIEFDDEEIRQSLPAIKGAYRIDRLWKVVENPNEFQAFPSKLQMIVLRKSAFENTEDEARFRSIMRRHKLLPELLNSGR